MRKIKPAAWLRIEARAYSGWFYASVLAGLLAALVNLVAAGLIAFIISKVFIQGATLLFLKPYLWSLLFVLLFKALLLCLKEWLGYRFSALVRSSLRTRLFGRIVDSSPLKTQSTAAEKAHLLLDRIESLSQFYSDYLPQSWLALFTPLMVLSVVFYFSWLLGLLLLITAPLVPVFMILIGYAAEAENKKQFVQLTRMSRVFFDTLQGLSILKWFGQSRLQAKKIADVSDAYRKQTMSVLRLAFVSSAVLEFFSAISIAIVAFILGLSLLSYIHVGFNHPLTLFSALFILLVTPDFYLPLRELGSYYHAKAEAVVSAENMMPIMELDPKLERSRLVINTKPKQLSFSDVCFGYSDAFNLIEGLSFSVQSGQVFYLVGESGCGKTTVIQLLMGLLSSTAGKILLDGEDISSFTRDAWLSRVSWSGQQPRLFKGTWRDNLPGREEEVESLLRELNLMPLFKRLRLGLDTPMVSQGVDLSGGELQRLAIARALLKKADIFLFDEPTASLNEENARAVLGLISDLSKNHIVIVSTHQVDLIPCDAPRLDLGVLCKA